MYYKLVKGNIILEYLDQTISLEHKGMFVIIESYNINNLSSVLKNLYTGIEIEYLSLDKLMVRYDEDENLFIGDTFSIEGEYVPDLIALFHQSEALRLSLVRPVSSPADTGGVATNHA